MLYRTISVKRSWTEVGYLAAMVALLGLLLYLLGTVLLPFVAACFAAYVLAPIVDFLERCGLSRRAAVACLYGAFAVLISGMVVYLIPSLEREIRTLSAELPRYYDQILQGLALLHNKMEHDFPILAQLNLAQRLEQASVASLTEMGGRLPLSVFVLASTFLFVPFITWYLLLEGTAMKKSLISCVPNMYFETTLNLLYRIDRHLSRYLFGQLINVVCISTLSAIGYSVIGVQFGIAIGILSGVATVIPYIGPLIGASAALLVSLLDGSSISKVISILLVSAVIYAFDHLVVKTVVISQTTDLHPLTTVIVLVIGGHVFGFWGLLFGIPLYCIAKIIFQEVAGVLQRRRPHVLAPAISQPTNSGILRPF